MASGRAPTAAPWGLIRRPPAASPRGESSGGTGWWLFEQPIEVLRADDAASVPALLARVERASADGPWAVGFVSYEAAPAFDPAFHCHDPAPGVPAAWFGLFRAPRAVATPPWPAGFDGPVVQDLSASTPELSYLRAVEEVRRWIARGETYQANLTYRLHGHLIAQEGASLALFRRLVGEVPPAYATYLALDGSGTPAVCSASPELFFAREPGRILCRPMKGTAPRGRTTAEDEAASLALAESPKERAENLMIVDMVRNDLGRVARPGGVRVRELFRIERYPTLFQMTSEVEAASDAGLVDVFGALFPCASITGAPKVRTMSILTELESSPRGVYTGAVGYVAPGGRARFSVAIRTAWVDGGDRAAAPDRTHVTYGTGGGVVWDSVPRKELAETRTKTLVLQDAVGPAKPPLRLLETLLWRPGKGYLLLDRHLGRLAESGGYFGIPVGVEEISDLLRETEAGLLGSDSGPARVRLLVGREGAPEVVTAPFVGSETPWFVALAATPVDERNPYLFHKTTRRQVYEAARRCAPDADDVLLWNRAGELTESTVANLVLALDGELVTPPAECGLLPGTLRAELLERGTVQERRLVPEDLHRADGIWLINSLRGWVPANLVGPRAVDSRSDGRSLPGKRRAAEAPAPSHPVPHLPSQRPR